MQSVEIILTLLPGNDPGTQFIFKDSLLPESWDEYTLEWISGQIYYDNSNIIRISPWMPTSTIEFFEPEATLLFQQIRENSGATIIIDSDKALVIFYFICNFINFLLNKIKLDVKILLT